MIMFNLTTDPHRASRLYICRLIIFLVVLFACGRSYAQWDNPSEKYAKEYLKYVDAQRPIEQDGMKHFVYFARDREAIHNHAFLSNSRFAGAQIMYSWSALEPSKGTYDFTSIQADVNYLQSHGKKLFIQLQDRTFNPKFRGVPDYLNMDEYDGGSTLRYNDHDMPEGWAAKQWNPNVQKRYSMLLRALGEAFDGVIEGINLQESSIGNIKSEHDTSFSPAVYAECIKANMLALKEAFPRSVKIQYANFMPGEWLPWEDKGYLQSIYQYGEDIGVGLGAPDLMPQRKGQLNHALAMMHEHDYSVPLGVAIQDGNYIGYTGADFSPGSDGPKESDLKIEGRQNIVPMLHAFAREFLNVQYMFWVDQKPYFEEDVLPCFGDQ
jgi:hypothetical protein